MYVNIWDNILNRLKNTNYVEKTSCINSIPVSYNMYYDNKKNRLKYDYTDLIGVD